MHKFQKSFIRLFCIITVIVSSNSFAQTENQTAANGQETAPEQVIVNLEAALLHSMQAPFDHTGRVSYLTPVIERTFDISRMARFLFGSNWRKQPADIQTAFTEAFLALSTANYADRFKTYNNEAFSAIQSPAANGDQALVKRQLLTAKGDLIPFDYALLKNSQGEWRMVNVIARGVSDLALKRTQYKQLFAQGGMQQVIDYINSEVERLAHQNRS